MVAQTAAPLFFAYTDEAMLFKQHLDNKGPEITRKKNIFHLGETEEKKSWWKITPEVAKFQFSVHSISYQVIGRCVFHCPVFVVSL